VRAGSASAAVRPAYAVNGAAQLEQMAAPSSFVASQAGQRT